MGSKIIFEMDSNARLAQWQSIAFTLQGSQVQSLHRAPRLNFQIFGRKDWSRFAWLNLLDKNRKGIARKKFLPVLAFATVKFRISFCEKRYKKKILPLPTHPVRAQIPAILKKYYKIARIAPFSFRTSTLLLHFLFLLYI